ncbi:MAG: hypothetical protein K9I85_15085, partial [Saprospiraceae bacterium]|nr:hypothetical protein [Saprospiraceae bacterium]
MDGMAQPACVVCCCGDPEEIGFPCGDFEVPPLAPFGGWIDYDAGQTYCGWTVVSGSISIHHGLHNNLGLGNPNGPSQHMDLNGYSFGTVERTLTGLIPGKQYSITLWYAAHNGAGLATCHALINNGALLDETWSTSITGDIKWDQRCLNFIADASSVLLRLAGSSNNPCCGMLIDDMTMWSCDADTESPVIFNPPPVGYMMQCQQNIPPVPQLVVTDNCDSYPEITFVEWVDSLACQFNYLRIWIVEDICGNTTSFQQTIAVEDTEPPVITNPPKDFEIPCGFDVLEEFYSWIQLNGYGAALDNCDHSLDWTADFVEEPGPACSVVLVTFVVTDDCGHSAEATATFTVKEVPPVILVPAHDVSINCAQNPGDSLELWLGEWGGAVAFDPCEPLVWQHNFSGDSLAPVIEVTFSVTNACGSVTETTAFFFQTVASDTLNEMALTCDPSLVSSDTIIQGVEGCQTVIITRIDLSPSDTLHLFGTTCEPSLSGSDTIFLQNQYGCDSLVITQTDLLPSSTKNIQLYTCDPLGAGLDTFNLTNQYGCDSIIYLTTTYSGIY